MVISVHVTQSVPEAPSFVRQAGYYGMFGVQLFFVLSAFSLSLAYNQSIQYFSSGFLRFMIRRWFRIAPLYILGIILYYILRKLDGITQPEASSIWYHASLLHGFVPSAFEQVVPGGWSIGCEWVFYLAFPVLHGFSMTRGPTVTIGLALLAAAMYPLALWIFGQSLPVKGWSFLTLNFACQAPCFLLGHAAHASWKRGTSLTPVTLFTVLCIGLLANGIVKMSIASGSLASPFFCGIAFASATLLALHHRIRCFILEWIGNVSYSMYILHFLFTQYLLKSQWFATLGISWSWHLVAGFMITVAGSAILAAGTRLLIENPAIKTGKWFSLRFDRNNTPA